ncbi:MAG: class A beta-lactamase-related serine hydrolase [Pseudomonadota bacterium]|nr:class A beta-lactamase-related serine hydrolase [Pseudomonadota bacterium]
MIKQLLAALFLGGAVLVAPWQMAGAAQSDDFDHSFDVTFSAKPPAPHVQAHRQAAAPSVQNVWAPAPTPLAVPKYLARSQSAYAPESDHAVVEPLPLGRSNPATSAAYAGPFVNTPFSEPAAPVDNSPFARRLQALAEGSHGRIGVAAMDLTSGRSIAVLGDQPFPLASTAKVAIVATFLADVDAGRLHLDDRFPMMMPLPSAKLSSAVAPARPGAWLSAQELIERALTLSDNHATDGLLAAIGGPQAVDRWLRGLGITGMRLDHNINTLVRDDGLINPATTVDVHDSTTPLTMVRLLAGLYQGNWLSPSSHNVLMGAMSRCKTGVHRMRLLLPEDALIGHKTGTLANTSSDVGIIRNPAGHTVALAIYVTGQGSKPGRESRIAAIARAVYDGYEPDIKFAGGSRTQ